MQYQHCWVNESDYNAYQKMRKVAISEVLVHTPSPSECALAEFVEVDDHTEYSGATDLISRIPLAGGARSPTFIQALWEDVNAAPPCNPQTAQWNRDGAAEWTRKHAMTDDIRSAAQAIDDISESAQKINEAIAAHDAYQPRTKYYLCLPEGQQFIDAYNGWVSGFNAALEAMGHAADKLLSNADREHGKLKIMIAAVQAKRQAFETLPTGGDGVAGIMSAHAVFAQQESHVRSFIFGTWAYQSNRERVQAFWSSVDATHNTEALYSAIAELDRLRDEYVVRKRETPPPTAFTQSASTAHFTFAQLNTGDYSWALLRPILLTKLEENYVILTSANYQVQLNSVFRNPARQDAADPAHPHPKGRHQYGDAVDWQVYDFNHDGKRDDKDWGLLHDQVVKSKPSYIEKISESGNGHVHTDWRNG